MSGSLFQWDSLNGLKVITNGVSNLPVFLSGDGRYIACVQNFTLMTWDSATGVSTVDSGLVNQNIKLSGFSGNGSNLLFGAYYPPILLLRDLNRKSNLQISDNVFEYASLSFDARFIAYTHSNSPSINSTGSRAQSTAPKNRRSFPSCRRRYVTSQ